MLSKRFSLFFELSLFSISFKVLKVFFIFAQPIGFVFRFQPK